MKHTPIIPSILSADFSVVRHGLDRVVTEIPQVRIVQIDMCDGHFTQKATWPYSIPGAIEQVTDAFEMPGWEYLDYEFDMMVRDPHRYIEQIKNMGASRVILHIDSEDDPRLVTTAISLSLFDIEIGIGVQTIHTVERVTRIVKQIAETIYTPPYIQIMGIQKIGSQGQPFASGTIAHIKALHEALPETIIQVDGAMNRATIEECHAAGASRFAVGSALFREGVPLGEALADLQNVLY